ncbi:MAG TPA: glycosyl transferase [Bacteroidales bacterium]|nr:glycosyl transferase [Bacteroidales bacterium]
MNLTVVVSYYKALENLKIILQALNNQSAANFEVIVSEDDFNEQTVLFLNENRTNYKFEILHLHQTEDHGFRKNKMLNKCLLACRTDYIAFIDGDCIPHTHFVKEYIRNAEPGYYISGRAVLLGEKTTEAFKRHQNLAKLSFCKLIFTDSEKIKDGIYSPVLPFSAKSRGLVGRNWGIHKKHLFEINGFDEDYQEAGVGEDTDVEWRLSANGIKRKSVKNKAIVYHLFHKRGYSDEGVQRNYQKMFAKQKANTVKCHNGIEKLK